MQTSVCILRCGHSEVWSRCPKAIFVGKRRVDGAVAASVSSFNAGAKIADSSDVQIGR